eukprot:m.26909 g.26909  ORF g.26909 m.26909 type:complete len:219 (+) comp11857_c0_seq1:119-775(+)
MSDSCEGGPDVQYAPRRTRSFRNILLRHKHPRDSGGSKKKAAPSKQEHDAKENGKSPGKKKLRRRLSLRRSKSLGPADQNALVARRVGAAVNVAQCVVGPEPIQFEEEEESEPQPVLLFGLNVTGMPSDSLDAFRHWVLDLGEETEALKADIDVFGSERTRLISEKTQLESKLHNQAVAYAKRLREVNDEVADLRLQNEHLQSLNTALQNELDAPEDV